MSVPLINQYYNNLDRAIQYSKSRNEDTIKSYFWMLLNDYAHKHNFEVVREVFCQGTKGNKVKPDGILKNMWGLEIGYWESKDEKDEIDEEIDAKVKKGYPLTNTLFEDSNIAVLFQNGAEILRAEVHNADKLHQILTAFISYESEVVHKFEDALEKFKLDIPTILETLRKRIDSTGEKNKQFLEGRGQFWELCKAEINPDITLADIREMMIQHVLTADIFNIIFDEPDFHRHNNIAYELEKLVDTLFTHAERKNLLGSIEHYYDAINATAANIVDHHEKQKFLKVLYENFYKVYNPKAADRLGVVYTPNEIVKFMVESADYLLHKHFGKTLADRNVEILDPAMGTGTFVCDIIELIPKQHLVYKYKNELHANEVAILPYYIANLNIEFTFKQKMEYYEEFPNVCFVDTLDNTGGLVHHGKQDMLFGLSSENAERIRRQNKRKISVIIGNPPYNANQKNENENNKNREYPDVDERIKNTFIKYSTAQKTKVYDMYARFYRWAMDRLEQNGIIAFISNRSFIDSRTFDGFRKCLEDEFSHAYIIDTKSDVRANPKIAGTTHNVFGIQTGVAIMFLVRIDKQREEKTPCRISYVAMEDNWRKEEKLEWLNSNKLETISFASITPDKNHNWINLAENDWEGLIPLANKKTKLAKKPSDEKAIFKLFSLGIVTARDEWVYDDDKKNLEKKIRFFIESYDKEQSRWEKSDKKINITDFVDRAIKFTSELEDHLSKGTKLVFNKDRTIQALYRPYYKLYTYFDKVITHRIYQQDFIFPIGQENDNVLISINIGNKPFNVVGAKLLPDYHLNGDCNCLPLYRYDANGNRIDNITDWGLEQFRKHYEHTPSPSQEGSKDAAKKKSPLERDFPKGMPAARGVSITKEDIFHYVYAVLHNPAYREKYELNLKREFPRIPFYNDFWKWTEWGKKLMELHINYETVEPYPLKVATSKTKSEHKKVVKEFLSAVKEPEPMFGYRAKIKPKLKVNKDAGIIEIDELTTLSGIPKQAWEYKLGNRSAVEWILDQYKEKKPSDPTIAEKFNTYRFADYKEKVMDLLRRVTTVSVETQKIIEEMKREKG